MSKDVPKIIKAELRDGGTENIVLINGLLACLQKAGEEGATFNDLVIAAYKATGYPYKRSSIMSRLHRLRRQYPIESAGHGRYRMKQGE